MTDQEARTEYEQLAALLDRENLGWLKAQVEAYFRFGKPERREVTVVDEEVEQQGLFGEPAHRPRRGPRANFLATVEYTPQERLQNLAMAISQAVPQLLEMANAIPELIRPQSGGDVPHVILVRESETGELEENALHSGVPAEKLLKLRVLLQQAVDEAIE
jgi:hypothetical protein